MLKNLSDFITPSYVTEGIDDLKYDAITLDQIKQPPSEELIARFKELRKNNKKVQSLWDNTIDMKPSRSERDFTLAKELKGEGFTLEETAKILWSFKHGKVKEAKYPNREIIRCYERSGNDFAEPLDPGYIAKIEAQVNPILEARKQGKPLEEDLDRSARFRSVELHKMKWRKSGRPIYKDFLYDGAITVIYGKSNTGKSFLTSDLAGHIALGRDWNGMKFKRKKPPGVLYIAAEAAQSFGIRGRALMQRLGVKELPFFVVTEAPAFTDDKMTDAKAIIEEIKRIKREHGVVIGLVVVDTLAVTFQGNENSSEDMGHYIRNMKYIQRHAETGVLIVHHSGKDQAAGARGSSALQAATDTEMEVKSEKRGEKEARSVEVKKQREGKSGMLVPFGLNVIDLGKDEDGDEIDTCHVVLEDDDLFEDVSGTIYESLTASHYYALQAAYLFETTEVNPDMLIDEHTLKTKSGKEFTRKEVVSIICKDLRERKKEDRILLSDVGVLVEHLDIVGKPVNRAFTKYMEDQKKAMEQIGIVAFDKEYQLVSDVKEHMELRKNKDE